MFLLDTDILVDCLRGTAPAREWLRTTSTDLFVIPGIAAMELLIGCRNRIEIDRVQKFLAIFQVAWPDAFEFA
jgi:predicted nucleic acid-binding protein